MSDSTARTALYRLYAADDSLLYVGVTGDPKSRFNQHRHDKSWWPEVTMKDIEWHASQEEALAAERRAIREERPRYNERGVPWRPELGQAPSDLLTITGLVSSPYGAVNHVLDTGRPLLITKHGKPILVLAPYAEEEPIGRVDQIAKGTKTGRRTKPKTDPPPSPGGPDGP